MPRERAFGDSPSSGTPQGEVPLLRTHVSVFDRGFGHEFPLGSARDLRTVTALGAALAPSRVPQFLAAAPWRRTRMATMRNPCKAVKPSSGLEPETPSLPWRCSTN
jgi:hypothetical protein